jgi:hypothetical protein
MLEYINNLIVRDRRDEEKATTECELPRARDSLKADLERKYIGIQSVETPHCYTLHEIHALEKLLDEGCVHTP